MPRYYRTFLATGLLSAMTLPALAQTAAPATVSPASTATTPQKVVKRPVTHNHHAKATTSPKK